MKIGVLRLLFLLVSALEITSEYPWKVIPMTGNNVTEKPPIKNETLPRTVDIWSHHQNNSGNSSTSKKLNSVEKIFKRLETVQLLMKDAMSKPEYPKNNPSKDESSSAEPQAKTNKMNSVDKNLESDIDQILKDAMSKPEYPKNNPSIDEDKISESDIEDQINNDATSKPEYPKNNPKVDEGSKSGGPDHKPDRSNDSSSASSVTKSVDSGRHLL